MNSQFECFIKNSPDAVAVITETGRLVFVNSKFSELLRIHADRTVDTSVFEYNLPHELKSALVKALKKVGETNREKEFRCDYEQNDKSFSMVCRLIPYLNGSKREVLFEIRDKTKLFRLKSRLQKKKKSSRQKDLSKSNRKLFFRLFDELPTLVYLQRNDYTVAFANKKVRELYGEPEGKLCYEVFAGRKSPCVFCPTFEVFEMGQSVEWEFTDGNGRTFLIYDYPFEDEDGEPLILEMGVDITKLKTVERELFQSQKLREIGVLAGGIAHDLNNNLVPIIFNIEYAREKVENEELSEPLEEALLAAKRATRLVAQVLEYSRQQDVDRIITPITPLIRSCVKDFQITLPDTISLQANLNIDTSSVLANPTQIQQVAMNLLSNAEQAISQSGSIHVNLKIETIPPQFEQRTTNLKPGKYIVLEISDTGKGIKSNLLDQIFDPFFTTKKSSGGTGMGLAVVHSIIQGNKGDILVESAPGIGTIFTVLLPLVEGPQTQPKKETTKSKGDNIKLLLVDDDSGVLSAMARSLRQADFLVDTAGSSEQGLTLFREDPERYGLILADHSMPNMTGLEMAQQMLAINKETKIVICTGHIEPLLEEQAKKEGVSGFARKPMSPKKLIETVMHHCQ